jgi:hypothetical protein
MVRLRRELLRSGARRADSSSGRQPTPSGSSAVAVDLHRPRHRPHHQREEHAGYGLIVEDISCGGHADEAERAARAGGDLGTTSVGGVRRWRIVRCNRRYEQM